MSAKQITEAALLGVVVLACWAGALGAWRMKEPMQGLHYCTIPATAGIGALTIAVFIETGSSATSWKTALIAVILVVVNAVGMHASGRAFRARELGHWEPEDQDSSNGYRVTPAGSGSDMAMQWLGAALLLLLAISGLGVVRTRDVTEQIIALGFYGLLLSLVFFFFQAPDVALSQIVVGSVALPLLVILAISRMKFRSNSNDAERGDKHD